VATAADEPSGGLGITFPLDPGANDRNRLVNPLDTGAGAGLTSTFPSTPDVGATMTGPFQEGTRWVIGQWMFVWEDWDKWLTWADGQ
jgi:hypothetical protein